MSLTAVIHQPDLLPHLAFFHRLLHADVLVLLDTVQFVRGTSRSWTHRDKIRTAQGERWFSLSVKDYGGFKAIREVELSAAVDWRHQHLELFRQNYRRAPHFPEIFPRLEALYARPCERLVDFTVPSIELLLELFDIPVRLVSSATLSAQGSKNELLVAILREIGATRYVSGPGARAYMDEALFAAAGISVEWQQFRHPVYPQQFEGFVAGLSAIDLLFNCGIAESRRQLRSG